MIDPIDAMAGTALGLIFVCIGYLLGGIRPNKELLDEKRRHEKTKIERDDYKMKCEEWRGFFGRFPQKAKQ